MSETETTKTEEPEEAKEPGATPTQVRTPEEMFRWMAVAQGKDPDSIQAMSKFLDVESHDETSYFPNQLTAIAIAQLRIRAKALYKGHEWNPFDIVADAIGVGFKGFKGFKSEQYKDITSGQPNLDKLRGLPEETQKGLLSGIFNRGKSE